MLRPELRKYCDIYKEIQKLTSSDTLELVLECEDEDEKAFFEMIEDYLLQKRQREVLQKNGSGTN